MAEAAHQKSSFVKYSGAEDQFLCPPTWGDHDAAVSVWENQIDAPHESRFGSHDSRLALGVVEEEDAGSYCQ
jgi:hypothetical protein